MQKSHDKHGEKQTDKLQNTRQKSHVRATGAGEGNVWDKKKDTFLVGLYRHQYLMSKRTRDAFSDMGARRNDAETMHGKL
jgi:hypothetical protein